MATVNRAEDVQDLGDADFVVRPGNAHWKGLHADLLFEDAFVPACSPSMAKRIKSLTNIGEATHVHSMMRPEAWSLWLTSVGLPPAAAAVRHISLANTALCIQAAADSVGVAMVQLAYIVEDLSNKRVVIPIQHIARTGSGYFLACDASRMNEYPLLQFREWAKRIAVAQNQRTNSALEMFCH
jgi:LysR family glycine cleavage system transcriptional activator/LysR family transcriptional regulator of beta-lactamase